MSSPDDVQFGILGPLTATRGGELLELGGPKQRAVLVSLILHVGRSVSSDRLVDHVWGDGPPARAIVSVQSYVSNLRKALWADGVDPRLTRTTGGYVLDVPQDAVDAHRFTSLAAQARVFAEDGDHGSAVERCAAALALWRGPAMADVADHPATTPEIARLDELRLQTAEVLAASLLELGREAEAVVELEPLVSAHPLRERTRALHVLALYRMGRQADALSSLRAARERIVDELGLDPGPELARLESDVLRQAPSLAGRSPAPPGSTTPAPRPTTPERPLVIGREPQLGVLRLAWENARAGSGAIVLVSGEAGIGKTRLIEAIRAEIGGIDGHVLSGHCFETAGAPVFWPWVQLLRRLVEDLDEPRLRTVTAGIAPQLAVLVPELKDRLTEIDPPENTDPMEARFRLLDAVVRTVVMMGRQTPALVLLEDIHRADEASLDVLRLLAHRIVDASVLVVATHRDGPADRAGTVGVALADLARSAAVTRLPLPPLDAAQVGALGQALAGAPLPHELATALTERSDGNPLFATQLMTQVDDRLWLPDTIPIGLQELLRQRVAELPDGSRAVLEAASVEGRVFTASVIGRVIGDPVAAILIALDPAVVAGLVSPVDTAGRYRFVHVLLRDALYDGLPPGRRAALHGAFGSEFESDDARAAETAHHFEQAAALGFGERALDAALRAAEHAEQVHAFADAQARLHQALRLLGEDPAREVQIHTRLASLLLMTEGYASPAAQQAVQRIAALTSREVQMADWARWVLSCSAADFGAAMDVAIAAVERVGDDGHAGDRAAAHQMMGTTLWHLGRAEASAAAFDRSLASLDELDPAELTSPLLAHVVSMALCHSASNLCAVGAHEESLRRGHRAVELAVGPYAQAFARQALAFRGMLLGDPSWSAEARWAHDVIVVHGFASLEAITLAQVGWHAVAVDGDPTGIDRIRQAIDAMAAVGVRMLRPVHELFLGDANGRLGRWADAEAAFDRGLVAADDVGEHMVTAELLRRRAECAWRQGGDGTDWAERAVATATAQGAAHLAGLARATAARWLA